MTSHHHASPMMAALLLLIFTLGAAAQQTLLEPPLPGLPPLDAPTAPPPLPYPAPPSIPELQVIQPTPLSRSSSNPSSTSASRQFIVFGQDLRIRSGIGSRCDEIAQELNRLLRSNDPWVYPIIVKIEPQNRNASNLATITSQVLQLDREGFHLQVTIPERDGLKPADLKLELIKILLAERILRTHKNIVSTRAELIPTWIHTGIFQALEYRRRTKPSAVFAAIFKSGKIYGIEEILDAQPHTLDGLSRSIYETSCCALVLSLLDQPDGPTLFTRFLTNLPTSDKPQRELLTQWFPLLAATDASLNKWWTLQLASLSNPGVSETLSPAATAELLENAITFQLIPQKDIPLPSPRPVKAILQNTTPSTALPTTAASPDSTTPPPSTTKPSTKPKAISSTADTNEEPADPIRTSFLRRFLGLNPKASDSDDSDSEQPPPPPPSQASTRPSATPTDSTPEDMSEREKRRAEARAEAAKKEEEKKRKKQEEQAAKELRERQEAEAKAAKKMAAEKAAAEKAAAEEAERNKAESSGSKLNPLNWFRGKKSSDTDSPPPAPDQDASAHIPPTIHHTHRQLITQHLDSPTSIPSLPLNFPLTRGRPIQALATTDPLPLPDPDTPLPPIQEPDPANIIQPTTTAPASAPASSTPFPIEDFSVILSHPDHSKLLKQATIALREVAIRGNVLFRPICKDYTTAIADLSAGKTKDMDKRLANLRLLAIRTYEIANAVQVHLDWYEANQNQEYSGLFDDFITLPNRLKEELPKRTDPISLYLDELEASIGK